jgi:hypothetical protein
MVMLPRFSRLAGFRPALVCITLLLGHACCAQPRTQPETGLEVAAIVDSGPGALAIDLTRGAGAGKTVHLEAPERFVVARAWREPDPTSSFVNIGFELQDHEKARFEGWTGARIDRQVALLVNGRLWTVVTIKSRLPGSGILTGGAEGFSEAEVEQILRDLDVPK